MFTRRRNCSLKGGAADNNNSPEAIQAREERKRARMEKFNQERALAAAAVAKAAAAALAAGENEDGEDISAQPITAYDKEGKDVKDITYLSCVECAIKECPAYLDDEEMTKYFKNIVFNSKKEDHKYVISFTNLFAGRFCVDIRTVIKEIQLGRQVYFLGGGKKAGGEFLYYFNDKVFPALVQKEKDVLGTSIIKKAKSDFLKKILPTDKPELYKRRIIIFKGLMLLIKLFTTMNVGTKIIAANLSPQLKDLYEKTTEYKKGETKTVNDAKSTKCMYNPFVESERAPTANGKGALSAEELSSNNAELDRVFSTRLVKQNKKKVMGLENRLMGRTATGLQRRAQILGLLDQDINMIKANSMICLLTKIMMLESGDISIGNNDDEATVVQKMVEKIKTTHDFLKLLRTNDGTSLIDLLSGIYGDRCMRHIGIQLVEFAERLTSWCPGIKGLDLSESTTIKDIPKEIRSCFFNLLTTSNRHTYNRFVFDQLFALDNDMSIDMKELQKSIRSERETSSNTGSLNSLWSDENSKKGGTRRFKIYRKKTYRN